MSKILFSLIVVVCAMSPMAVWSQAGASPCDSLHPHILSSACGSVCAGTSVILDAGSGYADYRWSNGMFGQRLILSGVEASGRYWCDLSTATGCHARTETTVVNISAAPAKPYIVQKDSVLLATSAPHISWYRNHVQMDVQDQESIVIHDSAEYSIVVSDEHGCSNSSEPLKAQAYSVDHPTRGNDARLKVYPNPTAGKLSVQLLSDYSGDIQFAVYDLSGKELYHELWQHPGVLDVYVVDLSRFADGSYILEARDGVDVVTTQVVVQH